jgi:DNA-binding transcriptional MocR family regulator
MISALSSQLPEAQIHGAAAGLHLMITFAADFADVDLAAAAYSRGCEKCNPFPGTAKGRSDLAWCSATQPIR